MGGYASYEVIDISPRMNISSRMTIEERKKIMDAFVKENIDVLREYAMLVREAEKYKIASFAVIPFGPRDLVGLRIEKMHIEEDA